MTRPCAAIFGKTTRRNIVISLCANVSFSTGSTICADGNQKAAQDNSLQTI